MSQDVDSLVFAHGSTKKQQDLALLEKSIRDLLDVPYNDLHIILQSSIYDIISRSFILNSGSTYAWELLDDDDFSLGTVVGLMRSVRKKNAPRSPEELDKALKTIFQQYKKKFDVFPRDGKLCFRKSKKKSDDWQSLRASIHSFFSEEFSDLDPVESSSLSSSFSAELDILIRQYKIKVSSVAKNSFSSFYTELEKPQIDRKVLICAFKELGISPPRPGVIPDRGGVSKVYKRIALDYHPDRRPGDVSAAEKFQRVNQAYQTIIEWMEASNDQRDGEEHVR